MSGLKNFFKSIFKPKEYEKEQDEKWNAECKQKSLVFYEKAKPLLEEIIEKEGYSYFEFKTVVVDGKEYRVSSFSWLENQLHRIVSEKFQMDYFGEIVFDENHDYNGKDRTYILKSLDYYSSLFGFCGNKFYLKNRNPYLKFLLEYHRLNPEIKITDDLLFTVKIYFGRMAELFVAENYGEDYYDKPGKLTEDERRNRAWSDEKLHNLLNELIDSTNPDNAALYAKNIGDSPNSKADLILKYLYCEYEDKYNIFFGNSDSKNLLSESEIERKLDEREE